MALEPITRQEQIIAGKDLEPITRMEKFLKKYGGGATSWNDLQDRPFGEIFVEVLPTTKIEVTEGEDLGFPAGFFFAELPELDQLENDTALKVTMNGVSYDTRVVTVEGEDESITFAGNWALLNVIFGSDFEDTGEPFLIGGMSVFTIDNVELSVLANETQTIPYKYLPKVPLFYFREHETSPQTLFATPTAEEFRILREATLLGNINVQANVIFRGGEKILNNRIPMRIMQDGNEYVLGGVYMTSLGKAVSLCIRVYGNELVRYEAV